MVLIRVWPFPPIAASVSRLLATSFPEFALDTIDIVPLVKSRKDILIINTLATIKAYGVPILLGKGRFKVFFWGTPFIFRAVSTLLKELLSQQREEIIFTFQLQSLFDTSQFGIPHFVYTDHTLLANLAYPGFDRASLYLPAWIELERNIYQNASCVFTRSHNISRSLTEQYNCPTEKVLCVYAGSNTPVSTDELDNDGYRNKNILFVGADWERKGGPVLVEAFLKVAQAHPDSHLTIVGCSPKVKHPQIDVVGRVPVQDVHKYFNRASVFCLSTRREPFGVVFVEALSYRLPIIATRVGATPDFVLEEENGYLVETDDSEGLARSLMKLIGNPALCRAFGDKSLQLAREKYNWQSVGSAIRTRVLSTLGSISVS